MERKQVRNISHFLDPDNKFLGTANHFCARLIANRSGAAAASVIIDLEHHFLVKSEHYEEEKVAIYCLLDYLLFTIYYLLFTSI